MNTLDGLAESIAAGLGQAHDFAFKERIKFNIKYWRALLIRQDVERNVIDRGVIQGVCLDLEKVDASECCDVTLGCKILRTSLKLPKVIKFKQKAPFTFAGTLNNKSFIWSKKEDWNIDSYKKYTSTITKYDYFNNYVYVWTNNLNLKHLFIKSIFEYPEEVLDCATKDSVDVVCYDENNYPMSMEMAARISELIIKGELRFLNRDDDMEVEMVEKQKDLN